MYVIVFMVHILVAIALIALVLIQHGKGAYIGAAFGSGASNTLFGSAGTVPFLVKVTGVLAAIFFVTCIMLGNMTAKQAKTAGQIQLPTSQQAPVNIPQK